MHIQTYVGKLAVGLLAALFVGQAALAAGLKLEYTEGKFLTVGGDMRVRFEGWDRNVFWPEGVPPAVGDGANVDYLRIRTRLMLGLDLWDGAKLDARFANRVHKVSSHWLNPNDQRTATWKYPDEIIIEQLVLTLTDPVGIDGLTLKLGRQDFILGNGMVMLEGTPYDQGRGIYFDGISAKYKTQCDVFTVFAFYDEYKDPYVVANDRERTLRRGDIFTTGIDWIHTFSDVVKTDLYYIYAKVHDNDTSALGARHFESNSNARLHIIGARVFGSPNEWLDYSLEAAHQFGKYEENPNIDSPGFPGSEGKADAKGWFVDARLTAKFADTMFSPKVMFQYSYFSGDDASTTGKYEGWDPLFAEYPMYREELLPIMLNGSWTNLHIYRLEGKLKLHERVNFTCAAAYMLADESSNGRPGFGGGNGSHFGNLYSAFLDITLHERVKTSFEAAFFDPGSYWAGNNHSEWLRWQTVFTF